MKKVKIEAFSAITMAEFLFEFVGLDEIVDQDKVRALSKATHKDIKELGIQYVKAVPFDTVTEEQILSGDIIIVADGKSTSKSKRYAPYMRPELVKVKEEEKQKREERRICNG